MDVCEDRILKWKNSWVHGREIELLIETRIQTVWNDDGDIWITNSNTGIDIYSRTIEEGVRNLGECAGGEEDIGDADIEGILAELWVFLTDRLGDKTKAE